MSIVLWRGAPAAAVVILAVSDTADQLKREGVESRMVTLIVCRVQCDGQASHWAGIADKTAAAATAVAVAVAAVTPSRANAKRAAGEEVQRMR